MSDKYKITEKNKAYFLTLTIVGWVDVFTRKSIKLAIIDSLKYCQENKGLSLFGWCLMSNHLHMIARADGRQNLSEILRDFKKYTAKKAVKIIEDEPESRRNWLLEIFQARANELTRVQNFKVWQDGNQAKVIYSPDFFYQKLEYIHQNPVKDLIVEKPEDYLFSSARNYAGLPSMIDIILESPKQISI